MSELSNLPHAVAARGCLGMIDDGRFDIRPPITTCILTSDPTNTSKYMYLPVPSEAFGKVAGRIDFCTPGYNVRRRLQVLQSVHGAQYSMLTCWFSSATKLEKKVQELM